MANSPSFVEKLTRYLIKFSGILPILERKTVVGGDKGKDWPQ